MSETAASHPNLVVDRPNAVRKVPVKRERNGGNRCGGCGCIVERINQWRLKMSALSGRWPVGGGQVAETPAMYY